MSTSLGVGAGSARHPFLRNWGASFFPGVTKSITSIPSEGGGGRASAPAPPSVLLNRGSGLPGRGGGSPMGVTLPTYRRDGANIGVTQAINEGHTVQPWAPSSGAGPGTRGYRGTGVVGSAAGALGSPGMPTSQRGRFEKFGPVAAAMPTWQAARVGGAGLFGGGLKDLYDMNRPSPPSTQGPTAATQATGAASQPAPLMSQPNESAFSPRPGMTPQPIGGGVGGNLMGLPQSMTLPGFADGGPVTGGNAHVVGEEGPEIFVPGKDGTIIPSLRTILSKILANKKS